MLRFLVEINITARGSCNVVVKTVKETGGYRNKRNIEPSVTDGKPNKLNKCCICYNSSPFLTYKQKFKLGF